MLSKDSDRQSSTALWSDSTLCIFKQSVNPFASSNAIFTNGEPIKKSKNEELVLDTLVGYFEV